MQLQTQRILVTGAAGGIGQPLCSLLAKAGAYLGLLDRGPGSVAVLHQMVPQMNDRAIAIDADLTRAEDRRHAVQLMNQTFGGVDVLINLAGILDFRPFDEADPGTVARILQVNVEAPMLLVRELLPQLIDQGAGRIVNVGSMFGSIAFPCFAAYSASKFAMRGFSQALRRELCDTGVGVTYVSPRAVRTKFNPDVIHHMAERGLMRMDEADAVARKIVHALALERDEVYLGFPESLFARINAVFPRLVDRSIRKQVPQLLGFARTKD